MANEVKLPRLGQGMEAGTITKWLKAPGDTVEKGEPLFEIDTDKVTQEVESDYAGVLLKITLESGEAPVGQTIAYIGKEGEEVALAEPAETGSASEAAPEKPQPVAEPKAASTPTPESDSAKPNQIRALRLPGEPERAPLRVAANRPALPRVHHVPAELHDPLERRSHVRDPEVRQREPIPGPAPALM